MDPACRTEWEVLKMRPVPAACSSRLRARPLDVHGVFPAPRRRSPVPLGSRSLSPAASAGSLTGPGKKAKKKKKKTGWSCRALPPAFFPPTDPPPSPRLQRQPDQLTVPPETGAAKASPHTHQIPLHITIIQSNHINVGHR